MRFTSSIGSSIFSFFNLRSFKNSIGLYIFNFGYLFNEVFIINFISVFIKPTKEILTGIEFNISLKEKFSSILLLILLIGLLLGSFFISSPLLISFLISFSFSFFSLSSLILFFSKINLIISEIILVKL